MSNSEDAKARAQATFKRKEAQAREGAQAWAEYEAKRRAVFENTQRLRALRLAKEGAEPQPVRKPAPSGKPQTRPRA